MKATDLAPNISRLFRQDAPHGDLPWVAGEGRGEEALPSTWVRGKGRRLGSEPWLQYVRAQNLLAPLPLRPIRLIAGKEFTDRLRSGWVVAGVLVWLGAIGLTSFLGLLQLGRIGVQGYDRTVISLLNLVQYLVPLLGLLLGHDLLVGETEEGTLRLILAGGVSRTQLLLGKFLGGCLSLAVPLLLGFVVAGAVIAWTARDHAVGSFFRLAASGLGLGVIFLALGLALSSFSRSRVQALVLALLAWCLAVFAFDLVALGCLVSSRSPAAAREIELVCDATHVNTAADSHADFEAAAADSAQPQPKPSSASFGWLALDPVDLFRAINLAGPLDFHLPALTTLLSTAGWLALTMGAAFWQLRRTDL